MRARTLLSGLALLAAACGEKPRTTPLEALEALRAALSAGDGASYGRLLDSESAAAGRQQVRERLAMLDRGDDPAEVLRGLDVEPEDLRRGSLDDVVARFFPSHSPLFRAAKWTASAKVVAQRQESPDSTWIGLRGGDGEQHGLWFARERGQWQFDQDRTLEGW